MTRHQVARIRFIRQRRTYTVRELAGLLEVHPRTVQQWHIEGLMAVEESHPLLFLGCIAKTFLKTRLAKRRQKLGPGEFFCMRCRRPRMSPSEKLKSSPIGKRIGKDRELVLLYGECNVCGCKMVRFTTQQAPNGGVFLLMPEVAEGR